MQFNKVETLEQAKELIKIMPEVVAIDTEYVKGNPRTTKLLSVIIADSERAWAVSPSLLPALTPSIKERKLVFLQDYNHCDTTILLSNGCDLRGTNCHDLITMHHLIDENANHDLGSRILDSYGDNYKSEFWSTYKNYEDAPEDVALEYACKDAIYTYRLGLKDYEELHTEIAHISPLNALYQHIRQLSASLFDTQLNGLSVNVKLMQETKDSMEKQIKDYQVKLREEFNDYCEIWEEKEWVKKIGKLKTDIARLRLPRPVFNFTSDRQVSWLVYEALKCEVITRTKAGNPSTDFETIQSLGASDIRLRTLVEFKDIKSLYATFVVGMLERVENEKIYPNFNVSGTSTGRISHSNPNMGNLPKSGVIRNFFVPSSGMCFIGADYSQLEVVIEANLTEDPQLLKIILEGKSKHDITAEGLGLDRNTAKTLNFALQYGAGTGKIRKILGVSQIEAEDIYKRYWELYSGVSALKEKVNKEIKETSQITNLAGRTRHFPKVTDKYEIFKQQRQAYNFLIQGVAAECCNRAFYRIGQYAKDAELNIKPLFSVHDEILCETFPFMAELAKQDIIQIMEQSTQDFGFKYPLKAVAYGPLGKWEKT